MKKLVLIFLFIICILSHASALPRISEDYYLNDGSVYDPDGIPVENILPDTLRLELYEGERAVIHVDVLPENATERSLSWSAPNRGIVKLTPDGATCSVLGLREGEETIEIRADGGAFRCVAVSVRREPILSAQSIYYDTEADETSGTEGGILPIYARLLLWTGIVVFLPSFLLEVL